MCFRTNYLYQCGHEEEEQYETCQLCNNTGFCCDEYTEQSLVMPDMCVTCKLAATRAVITNYLYQCGHEEKEQYGTCQLYIDAGSSCDEHDEHEEQNVVMPVMCVTCKLAAMRADVEQQSYEAEMAGGEEGDETILQWK